MQRMTSKQCLIVVFAWLLAGCQTTSEKGPAQKSMDAAVQQQVDAMSSHDAPLEKVPDAVTQALLPEQSLLDDPMFGEDLPFRFGEW